MSIVNTANFNYRFRDEDFVVNASSTVEQLVEPIVTISKKAHPSSVYRGDVITYAVTIEISDFNGQLTNQVFSDTLPSALSYIEGTLTVDAEPLEGNPSHIEVNWMPNSSHLILYQCLVS